MKVLLVHNYYRQAGGERAAVQAQIKLLSSYGHGVIQYMRDSSEIDRYGLAQKAMFFPRTVYCSQTRREIQALIKDEQPALVHVHNVFPLISPSVYSAINAMNVPVVQTVHNFRFLCPNALFYTHEHVCERCKYGQTRHAVRWKCYRQSYSLSALYALTIGLHRRWDTFQRIDRWIALSSFSKQKLVESRVAKETNVSVLGNPLPDPMPSPGSFEKREPYFVYMGRLSPEKGVHVLLEAISQTPDLKLKVLGIGPQARHLKTLVEQKGLQHIEFMGYVSGETKWDTLRKAQALIIPSLCYENFPISALESLCAGTPVIASDLGSLPQLVQDGKSGLLFTPGDARALQRKLTWLTAHPETALVMGHYGRQLAETRYRSQVHYEQLVRIYDEVLN